MKTAVALMEKAQYQCAAPLGHDVGRAIARDHARAARSVGLAFGRPAAHARRIWPSHRTHASRRFAAPGAVVFTKFKCLRALTFSIWTKFDVAIPVVRRVVCFRRDDFDGGASCVSPSIAGSLPQACGERFATTCRRRQSQSIDDERLVIGRIDLFPDCAGEHWRLPLPRALIEMVQCGRRVRRHDRIGCALVRSR